MRTPDENGLDKVEAMYREWNTLPGIVMRGMHCYDGHRHESSVQEREVATPLWTSRSRRSRPA